MNRRRIKNKKTKYALDHSCVYCGICCPKSVHEESIKIINGFTVTTTYFGRRCKNYGLEYATWSDQVKMRAANLAAYDRARLEQARI